MDSCFCINTQWPAEEQLLNFQYIADLFIAVAYFSIPLELIYFVHKSAFFPYRWVLIQFGAFIVLCGATHFISLWTFSMHSKTILMVLAIAKMSTAAVSCVTALMFVHIIPDLLSVKTQESFLRSRVDELDREMGIIIKQEETGRHVRMLTHEIRNTLDRQTILRTTLVELGRILDLEECTLWMPSRRGLHLQVSHTLSNLMPVGSTVPSGLPILNEVFSSSKAIRIPPTCPLAGIKRPAAKFAPQEVAAVRVPLLNITNFQINHWPELSAKGFAVMVLFLPANGLRKWRDHELELVEVVTDQVAVALSHAAILEESMRARDQLMTQNIALDLARQEAEVAVHARKDFLAVMNHEMRTPMHAVIALCSLLLETELTPEQRLMMETILKSSNLLATFINDVLNLSRLEDGSLQLDIRRFNLPELFKEVVALVKPIAAVKRLPVNLTLALDLPVHAIGDESRLMQIMLNVVGNAIKFTKEGNITIEVSAIKQEYSKDWDLPQLYPAASNGQFHLQVQVKDTGCGVAAKEIPLLFTKFAKPCGASSHQTVGTYLGLAICKRFVDLMGGSFWIESGGLGKGTTVTFSVRLEAYDNPSNEVTEPAAQNAEVLQYRQFGRETDGIYLSVKRHQKYY